MKKNADKITSIHHYKYAGKFIVNYSSPAGKYSVSCDSLEGVEKRFLRNAKRKGAIWNCVNMTIYA